MEPLTKLKIVLYSLLYCGLALLIHFPGITDYFAIPEGRETLIASYVSNSPILALQIAAYAVAVLILNLIPLFLLLVGLRVLHPLLRRHNLKDFPIFLLAVLCLWSAALAFNKLYFPRSSFNLLLPLDDATQLRLLGFGSLAVYVLIAAMPAAWSLARGLSALLSPPFMRAALAILLALGLMQPLQSRWSTTPGTPSQKPNIILIGIDSLTPLHMQHHPGALPILETLLSQSTVFTNTITPLARTFPAWTSVLTAKYPVNSGARFNLTAFEQVETRATLANVLKAQGYTTIYAQDERKFNNIDEHFGFDRTVGPKAGAAEFVLTKASDHPLANLALLSPWGKILFPFVALNRADHVHYDPDEFVDAIIDSLPADARQPLFLASHFCLAHYPYTWRTQSRRNDDGTIESVDSQHISALQYLERQIDGLLQALRVSGRLDNTILVILSDHGESLGYADGHWISLQDHHNPHDVYETDGYAAFPRGSGFSGHGTDTLDRTQYQSLLAFQGFGPQKAHFAASVDDRISSLVDVMPTVLGRLGLVVPGNIDGVDLLAKRAPTETRTVPAETGIRFLALTSIIGMDENALLRESKEYYDVDPESGRLVVKPGRYEDLVMTKDLAVHTEDWILALLRKDRSPMFSRVAVLVHKPSGAWTTGNDGDLIRRAPMQVLTAGLRRIYGKELTDFETTWVFKASVGG